MTWAYGALVVIGAALATWARLSLPADTIDYPIKVRQVPGLCTVGPYRWLRHPMYLGTILLLTGLGGLAAGIWNALAFMTLSELVLREWAWRERPGRIWP